MPKFVEGSLIFGILLAVLAFGGGEPVSFAIVELIFLAAAAALVVHGMAPVETFSWRTFTVPLALVGVVLLQLCPLPSSWVLRLGNSEASMGDVRWSSWSIEPLSTRNQLLILVTCLIAFFFAQLVSHERKPKGRLVLSLLGLGTFEAFYGLVQYLSGWQQIFAYVKKYDLEEATGTYINRNHFAGLLEMILPFSLALAFYEFEKLRRRQAQSPRRKHKLFAGSGFARAIFWVAVAVLIGVALLFSRSRMGILAGVLSSLFLFGLVALSRLGGRSGLWLAGAFLVLGLALTLWIGPGPVLPRFQV